MKDEMKADLITAAKIIKHLCIWAITCSAIYIASWFYYYPVAPWKI